MIRPGRGSSFAAMSLRLLCPIHSQANEAILLFFIVLLHVTILAVIAGSKSIGTSSYFGGNETDHQALMAFKTHITFDPQNIFSSWNDSIHFCEWEGVTCGHKHKRVTVLDLHSKGLESSLSPFIGNLSFIREIVLSNNTIGGKILDEFGRLFRLRVLRLYNNSFNGEIPANLSHCFNLYFFDVGRNNLSGSIPMELSFLLKLEVLYVDTNNLKGGIPTFIENLSSLQILFASNNVLGGHIPDTLGQLRNLTDLEFSRNKLFGLIPPSLYNLSSITFFSLSQNKLSGSLPTNVFLTLPLLQWFVMYENRLTGSLPILLSNASKLEYIEADANNFSGKISVNFGGLHRLEELLISSNNLGSGDDDEMNFFQSLVNCSSLRRIDLAENQFKGMLPKVLGNLSTHLIGFSISENLIFGEIP